MASVPGLTECHTQARSLDDLASRVKEANALDLEVEGETREPLEFFGIQQGALAS